MSLGYEGVCKLVEQDEKIAIYVYSGANINDNYEFRKQHVLDYRELVPSSTTLLVMCVMPTAAIQLNARVKNPVLRWCAVIAIVAFTAFMVIGRLVSGVHWFTDIVGGALLSAGLVMLYYFVIKK